MSFNRCLRQYKNYISVSLSTRSFGYFCSMENFFVSCGSIKIKRLFHGSFPQIDNDSCGHVFEKKIMKNCYLGCFKKLCTYFIHIFPGNQREKSCLTYFASANTIVCGPLNFQRLVCFTIPPLQGFTLWHHLFVYNCLLGMAKWKWKWKKTHKSEFLGLFITKFMLFYNITHYTIKTVILKDTVVPFCSF